MAEKLKINEMVFNHSNTVMEVVKRNCGELLKINSTESYCFFGLFAAHIMEKGFGMNTTNLNWNVTFESKVSSPTQYVGVTTLMAALSIIV